MSLVLNDSLLSGAEVVQYQVACGSNEWGVGTQAVWDDCIARALAYVTVRESGRLVALGFLAGNLRHADPVDVSVHPKFRGNGFGKAVVRALIKEAMRLGVRYITLVRDPSNDKLTKFYEGLGFTSIDFVMTYTGSLNNFPKYE